MAIRCKVWGAVTRALTSFDRAIATSNRTSPKGGTTRNGTLSGLKRHEDALASYDKALAIKLDHAETFGTAAATALWEMKRIEEDKQELMTRPWGSTRTRPKHGTTVAMPRKV